MAIWRYCCRIFTLYPNEQNQLFGAASEVSWYRLNWPAHKPFFAFCCISPTSISSKSIFIINNSDSKIFLHTKGYSFKVVEEQASHRYHMYSCWVTLYLNEWMNEYAMLEFCSSNTLLERHRVTRQFNLNLQTIFMQQFTLKWNIVKYDTCFWL